MILFANGLCRCNQGKIRPLEWAFIHYDCSPYRKGKSRHRDRHTNKDMMMTRHRRRTPRDDEGRNRSGATVSQGCWRLLTNLQKLGRGKENFPYRFQKKCGPAPTLIWGTRIVRQYISIVFGYPVCGTLSRQPQETKTIPEGPCTDELRKDLKCAKDSLAGHNVCVKKMLVQVLHEKWPYLGKQQLMSIQTIIDRECLEGTVLKLKEPWVWHRNSEIQTQFFNCQAFTIAVWKSPAFAFLAKMQWAPRSYTSKALCSLKHCSFSKPLWLGLGILWWAF